MAQKMTIILVSEAQNKEFIEKAGLHFATDVNEAYEMAKKQLPENFTITIMEHGANTLPKLSV